MTIPSNVTRNSYTGTGITGPYPVTFKFFEDADLKVTVADTDGVETVKTLTTDYTVTGAGEQSGGSITFTTAVTNGYSIVIEPKADLTQDTDIKNEGGNLRESLEDRFDRLCRDDQVQQNLIDRSVKMQVTDVAVADPVLPPREAGALLGWNDSGTGFANRAASLFESDASITATGSTTARWISDRFADVVNVKDYGAVGDGVTDDTTAIDAAIIAGAGRDVFFPAGTYSISARLDVAADGTRLLGAGRDACRIVWTGGGSSYSVGGGAVYGTTGKAAVLVTADDCSICGLGIEGPSDSVYVAGERLVVVCGQSAASRLSGFRMDVCELTKSGSAGVLLVFADFATIANNIVSKIGYEAISTISCNSGRVVDNEVDTVSPGVTGNAYGISLSHDTSLWPGDQTTSPFSDDWLISGNRVRNIPWEGISNHGGWRHTVIGNHVYNVPHSISLGNSSGGASGYSGGDHAVIGNECDAGPDYANNANAFCSFRGDTTQILENVRIIGNTFNRMGVANSDNGGVLRLLYAKSVIISGNCIKNWRSHAIYIAGVGSSDIRVTQNSIVAMAAADSYGYAIATDGDVPGIQITGNAIRTDGGVIANRGISQYSAATYPFIVGGNAIEATTTASTPLVVCNSAPGYVPITTGAATYSVAGLGAMCVLSFSLAAPQTVTNFTGGIDGQILVLHNVGSNAVTITRDNAYLPGSANVVLGANESISLLKAGSTWKAVAPKANNG